MKIYSILFLSLVYLPQGCNDHKAEQVQQKSVKEQFYNQILNMQFDSALNNAHRQMHKSANAVTLYSTPATDYFIEPGGAYKKNNAPLLLKKVDNTKPFTFTVKMKPGHKVKYDAGMAFIYIDNKHWLKFAFEADEQMRTRIVTVKTNDYSDDNNHDVVKDSSVLLKISSDTRQIGLYYSVNNYTWQLVRVFKNDYPSVVFIGVGTQSPAGNGNTTIIEGLELKELSIKDFRTGL